MYISNGTGDKDDYVAIGTHVDDMLCVGAEGRLAELTPMFQKHFKVKNVTSKNMLLGMQLSREANNGAITLTQENYIVNMIEKHGIGDMNKPLIPLSGLVDKSEDKSKLLNTKNKILI